MTEKKLARVANVFKVEQGVRTGNNLVFKVSSYNFETLPDNEKKYFRPVIDNESITNGFLHKGGYIWYPYDKNGLILKSEDELEENVPTFYQNVLLERLRNQYTG